MAKEPKCVRLSSVRAIEMICPLLTTGLKRMSRKEKVRILSLPDIRQTLGIFRRDAGAMPPRQQAGRSRNFSARRRSSGSRAARLCSLR